MSDNATAIIDHRLGKVEAVRRLKAGLAQSSGHLGAMIAIEEANSLPPVPSPEAKATILRCAARRLSARKV